jgi:hypothetical protein
MKKHIALAAVVALMSGGIALAAQQGAAAKKLLVKNPPSGNKRLLFIAKNTTGTVVGNPVLGSGATLNVSLTPGGSQCMGIPGFGGNEGWSQTATGFKYNDPILDNGPVRSAFIKVSPSGNFVLKVLAKGAGIAVAPGNPTATYALNFSIAGGDEYCASTGSAIPTKNDEKTFLVKNDDGTACAIPACSSPGGAFLDTAAAF